MNDNKKYTQRARENIANKQTYPTHIKLTGILESSLYSPFFLTFLLLVLLVTRQKKMEKKERKRTKRARDVCNKEPFTHSVQITIFFNFSCRFVCSALPMCPRLFIQKIVLHRCKSFMIQTAFFHVAYSLFVFSVLLWVSLAKLLSDFHT